MGGDFDNVVSGVGMWLGEIGDYHFINALAASWLDQLGKDGAARLKLVLEPQQRSRNRAHLGTGETHYADAAASRRRGHGDDGVVKIHCFCTRSQYSSSRSWRWSILRCNWATSNSAFKLTW